MCQSTGKSLQLWNYTNTSPVKLLFIQVISVNIFVLQGMYSIATCDFVLLNCSNIQYLYAYCKSVKPSSKNSQQVKRTKTACHISTTFHMLKKHYDEYLILQWLIYSTIIYTFHCLTLALPIGPISSHRCHCVVTLTLTTCQVVEWM